MAGQQGNNVFPFFVDDQHGRILLLAPQLRSDRAHGNACRADEDEGLGVAESQADTFSYIQGKGPQHSRVHRNKFIHRFMGYDESQFR